MKHRSAAVVSMAAPEWVGHPPGKRPIVKAAILTLVFALGSFAAQLFQENFSGAVPGGSYPIGTIPGTQFAVTAGNVDVVGVVGGSYFSCADHPSGNCLDLIGSVGTGAIGSVPTFNLTGGTTYTITFGVVVQGVTTNIDFSVGLGTFSQTVTATPSPSQITVQFVAATSQSGVHLTFTSITNPDNFHGAVLDNIVLSDSTGASVLPQFVSGEGWYSALYFTNTTATAISFTVNFIGDDGNPLTVPEVGGSSTIVNLVGHGTATIQTANIGPLSQGYASVSLPPGVVGYGLFHLSTPGVPDQEAVVPLSGTSTTISTLIWDDTSFVTAVAIANPSNVATTVSIVLRDTGGSTLGTSSVFLPAKAKRAVVLRNLPGLGAMAGNRGSADFTVASGNVAVLGLRFIGSAFTSIPTADR